MSRNPVAMIDCKPYAGSVDFTIGSSKREKEKTKYIVGIELEDRYKKSVDEAFKEGVKALHFTANGEPLLHKGLEEMMPAYTSSLY